MSDLACAATLLLARHGKADYVEDWFSDEGGSLNAEGRAQAHALAARVRDCRITQVWSSDTSRAVQTAEIVAADLGLVAGAAVVARKSLREVFLGGLLGTPFDLDRLHGVTDRWFAGDLDVRFPGGESGREVVERYRAELETIVDQARGETTLVIVHQTATSIVLPQLALNVSPAWAQQHPLENGELVQVLADSDGWRMTEPN